MNKVLCTLGLLMAFTIACDKDPHPRYHYYEVGLTGATPDWRDTSFVVATNDTALIRQINQELTLPVNKRKILNGALVEGNGGYNRNAGHAFGWRLKENDWHLTDMSAEALDGNPYTDVDQHLRYWVDTVQRFSPWHSYIKRELGITN